MKSFTSADLESLTRGRSVVKDAFLAMLADGEACDEITRLVHAQEIREAVADWQHPEPDANEMQKRELEPPPPMSVTFEELARYAEQRLTDLARVIAVERFLAQHFPEYLARVRAAAAGADTLVELRGDTRCDSLPADQETQLELRTDRAKGSRDEHKRR
jgi:hypothetical protein